MSEPSVGSSTRSAVIGDGITWLSTWTLRWIILGIGAVGLGLVIGKAWSIVLPVLLALVLTTVLRPPAQWLSRRLSVPIGVTGLFVILAGLGVLAAIVWFVAPSIAEQVSEIGDNAAAGLTVIEDWLRDSGIDVSAARIDELVQSAQRRLQSSASLIATGVLGGVAAVTSALITGLVTLVLSFLMIKDGHRFLPWLSGIGGPRVGGHLREVSCRAWITLSSFVRTQALVGLIDAVLIGLGLVIVGVPLALALSILTFFAAFAPVIGAVVVGALAVLVALVTEGWVAALIILAVVLAVQQLEGNVLLPFLQGQSLNLHAGVVLLTIVLGSTLFGVAGAFLGVPIVAVAAVVLRYLNEQIAERSSAEA